MAAPLEASADSACVPGVSVVITTHNRLDLLQQAISPVLADPSCAEVLVVADNCRDGTVAWATELAQRDPRLSVLDLKPGRGQARARLAGVEAASQPVVLSIDDDVLLAQGCVSGHAGAHAQGDEQLVVVGYMPTPLPAPHEDPARWNYSTHYEQRTRDWEAGKVGILSHFWAGHFSLPRELFLRATAGRNLDIDYHEDRELGEGLTAVGAHAVFRRDLASVHRYARDYRRSRLDLYRSGSGIRELERRYGTDLSGELPHLPPGMRRRLLALGSNPLAGKLLAAACVGGVSAGRVLRNDSLAMKAARFGWDLAVLEGYARGVPRV